MFDNIVFVFRTPICIEKSFCSVLLVILGFMGYLILTNLYQSESAENDDNI
jgi:hypothetical protein